MISQLELLIPDDWPLLMLDAYKARKEANCMCWETPTEEHNLFEKIHILKREH